MVARGPGSGHRKRRELRLGVDREALAQLAIRPPRVDPAVCRRGDDLEDPVVVEVADGDAADRIPRVAELGVVSVGRGRIVLGVQRIDRCERARVDREARHLAAVGPQRMDRPVVGAEDEIELVPAGEVGIGGRGAHLGADVLGIAGEQIRVVARVEGSPVLALQPVAVVRSKAKRHGVLLGAVRRERRAWALGGVLPPDPAQVQHAQQAALGALARGDRLKGVVVRIRAERELQRPANAPGSPGARGDMPLDRQRPLACRVDVGVPVRRAELGGGGHLARLDQRGRGPDVGAPIPVLGGPVGVRGVGGAAGVAGPLVRHARRLGLWDHCARGVHHHLADLVRRQPAGDRSRVARVERRGLHHRQHARLERRRARGAVSLAREDVVGPVARHVASGPEGVGVRALRILGQGVPGEHVVVEHPVGVVHRVEVVRVEREEHPVAVRVVDGVTGEARVRVGDDHRADHARPGVGRVDDGGRELVASRPRPRRPA